MSIVSAHLLSLFRKHIFCIFIYSYMYMHNDMNNIFTCKDTYFQPHS